MNSPTRLSSPHVDRGRVLARTVLLVFLISIGVFNTNDTAWPAVSWPMFSTRTTDYPRPGYSAEVIRVYDTFGKGFWVRAGDLWGIDRKPVADRLIEGSIDVEAPRAGKHRRALMDCIRMRFPDSDVQRLEIWRLNWEVDLDAVERFDLENPDEAVLIAAFGETELGVHDSSGDRP